jgi:hypothetical protein
MLYADEYHRFATPAFATLLEEARKFGMATCLAHQRRSQLDHAHRAAPLGAVNLVVFGVSGEDGQELAVEFDRTPPPPEVIGQKPIQVLAPRPIQHILSHGHINPMVVFYATELSQIVAGWLSDRKNYYGQTYMHPQAANATIDAWAEEYLWEIDEYLHDTSRLATAEIVKATSEVPLPPEALVAGKSSRMLLEPDYQKKLEPYVDLYVCSPFSYSVILSLSTPVSMNRSPINSAPMLTWRAISPTS